MTRRIPRFMANRLSPIDEINTKLNLHIKAIKEIITSYKRWLNRSNEDETVEEYIQNKIKRSRRQTGTKFLMSSREGIIKQYYYDTILKYKNLPKDVWVNQIEPITERIRRKGHLEDFQCLLELIINQINNNQITLLINRIKEIFFVEGDSDIDFLRNLFRSAEEWRETLISLITLPKAYNENEHSNLPFLTDEAIKVLFSITKQFNSAFKNCRIENYIVPIVPTDVLLSEWAELHFQNRYIPLLEILGFRKNNKNWFPSLNNLPFINENLISILRELDLCEITHVRNEYKLKFTLDSYSLHLIYYSIILKNLNNISEIAKSWISYYFTRVIYSYYKAKLEANSNPLAHLMEEANFREQIFVPLWKIIARYLPIQHNSSIKIEREWLHSSPKETDEHIKKILEYLNPIH
ncbi:MAG: hypothetical protein ACTSRP_07145 [Candidatus Helarchaeota archaeon]